MWPFEDDKPEWVKARDKRARTLKDGVLRLIPCPACDGSGFMFHYDDPNLIGLPPMCSCCHYRGRVSYEELAAWRKKQDEKWEKSGWGKYFKSKEFEKHLDELIEEAINDASGEIRNL